MTDDSTIDSGYCPHCRAEIDSDDVRYLTGTGLLACPDCQTLLGSETDIESLMTVLAYIETRNFDRAATVAATFQQLADGEEPPEDDVEALGEVFPSIQEW